MTSAFVVDGQAADLSTDLNGIVKREKQNVRFTPIPTIEQLFRELEKATPDLILLHHHWDGLTISQILERITQFAETTRVIVFTGQSLDANDLIECARSGVADYWPKRGDLEPSVVSRQIAFYCSGPEWTLKKLLMPSGAQRQLIREAAPCQRQLALVTDENREMKDRIEALENADNIGFRRLGVRLLTFGVNCAVLNCGLHCVKYQGDRAAGVGKSCIHRDSSGVLPIPGRKGHRGVREVEGRLGPGEIDVETRPYSVDVSASPALAPWR